MPKIRTLKREFYRDPALRRAGDRTRGVMGVLIVSLADDDGRCKDEPETVRDEGWSERVAVAAIDACITALEQLGKLVRYSAGGEYYIAICKFDDHQYIAPARYVASRLPAPAPTLMDKARDLRDEDRKRTRSPSIHETSPEGHATVGGGSAEGRETVAGVNRREGKGEGLVLPSDSYESSGRTAIADGNDAPFEEREPTWWNNSAWKRTQKAIHQYEKAFPNGNPVTVADAEELQGIIKEHGVGVVLSGIQRYQGSRYADDFEDVGISYVFKPIRDGQFGQKDGKKKQPKPKDPEPFDGRRGQ